MAIPLWTSPRTSPLGPLPYRGEIKNGIIAWIDDNRVVDFEIVIGL